MSYSYRSLTRGDRRHIKTKFGLNTPTLDTIERMGMGLHEAIKFLEERLKRGLPTHPVWTRNFGT